MVPYVLLMLLINPTPGSAVFTALAATEFNSLGNCERAASVAKQAFEGGATRVFYVCVVK